VGLLRRCLPFDVGKHRMMGLQARDNRSRLFPS
jgi:hypothetical protein